jgi:nucleoside-diphosphate-sugar epimerase
MRYGRDRVIVTDKKKPSSSLQNSGPFEYLDVMDEVSLAQISREQGIDTVCHLAAILSATGEQNMELAWNVNIEGLRNVLRVAQKLGMARIFWPSSIAVFSPDVPRVNTPQDMPMIPRTMYGVTKACGELLCSYYFHRFGLDTRSLRYPGVIGSETAPGGGTTDYAVEMFFSAVKKRRYTCFLEEDTVLPMMYMVVMIYFYLRVV